MLEHFDAYTIIYDHEPVAVEIKGSFISQKALATVPRLDKRLIQSRVEEELNQVVCYTEGQEIPHWTLDQHKHRQEFTNIIHGATEAVSAKKIKPMKPYVTEQILEDSAYRARLIKSKSREEKQAKRLDQKRAIVAWKYISHWIAGHRRPTHELLGNCEEFRTRICQRLPDTNVYQLLWHKALTARAKA